MGVIGGWKKRSFSGGEVSFLTRVSLGELTRVSKRSRRNFLGGGTASPGRMSGSSSLPFQNRVRDRGWFRVFLFFSTGAN
jgi:hypothetical protein